MEIQTSMQIWWCHSSTFKDTPYNVYIFLKLRAFISSRGKQNKHVEMLDHCELRAWGTLSQVGVSEYIYIEIHLLHCSTYGQRHAKRSLMSWVVILKEGLAYVAVPGLLLVWQWLRTLRTFLRNAAHMSNVFLFLLSIDHVLMMKIVWITPPTFRLWSKTDVTSLCKSLKAVWGELLDAQPVHVAWWAHMRHFLSVTYQIIIHISESIIAMGLKLHHNIKPIETHIWKILTTL